MLCRILERPENTYTIRGDTRGRAEYDPRLKTLFLDPDYHPLLDTTAGKQPGETDVIMGHEMGHMALGSLDGRPGEPAKGLDNINLNENPIRDALGRPLRLSY